VLAYNSRHACCGGRQAHPKGRPLLRGSCEQRLQRQRQRVSPRSGWRPCDAGGADDITLVGVVDSGVFNPGCAEVELRWVAEAHARGNFVIGMGPAGYDRLREACDAYLPTACAEGGVIETQPDGLDRGLTAICPTGGIVNNILMQMLHAQFAEEMIRRGHYPLWQMGSYRTGGREFNLKNDKLFLQRGF
jgi:hypothetical protein